MSKQGILSEQEEKFQHLRQRLGFILAPLILSLLWGIPIVGLNFKAHTLLAILGFVVTLWITEAIPMPVTALLGPTLCIVAGIEGAKNVFKNFADPIIFLFMGSFFLAQAMFRHRLDQRIAFQILGLQGVGESPTRILLTFGLITALLSMWISNTTATAIMFPIGVSILSEMARRQTQFMGYEVKFTELKYGTGLMLMAAFAASIGGLATPVGTPPNLIGIGMLQKYLNIQIPFFQWMAFGGPLAFTLIVFLVFYLNRACPADPGLKEGNTQWIQAEKAKLGPLTRAEKNVLLAFFVTVILWLLPGIVAIFTGPDAPFYRWLNERLPEAVAALIGASLLFVLPINPKHREFTLTWRDAEQIDWGTILLFGGGLALGELMFSTGLAKWIGEGLAGAVQVHSALSLTVLFTLIAVLVSETTSNTASASMIIPIAIAIAQAAGVNPLQPALGACLGASMGFMMPVSTPPNAIVYGSGCVPLTKMITYGLLLDMVGSIVIIIIVMGLVPLIL